MSKNPLPTVEEPRPEQCETCRFRVLLKPVARIAGEDGLIEWESDSAGAGERRISLKRYEQENDEPTGECRRYPPFAARNEFPAVFLSDWCGEWQAKLAPRNPMLDRPISDLGLSVRSQTIVTSAGIRTIGELCDRQLWDLLAIKGFRGTCPSDVREKLAVHGLKLKGE